jgi:hypothetical protein
MAMQAPPLLDPRPPVDLGDGLSALAIADACRDAIVSFVVGSATSWGKSGLAVWLAGPYRLLVRHAPRVEGPPRRSDMVPASVRTQLASQSVEAIVASARQEVLTTLKLAPQNASFARSALHAGYVRRSRDHSARSGYVPVDHERMRLSDRVLSLAAVDYLMRPSDYLALLTVCKVCEKITFDPHTRARGLCHAHAPSLRRIPIK